MSGKLAEVPGSKDCDQQHEVQRKAGPWRCAAGVDDGADAAQHLH